MCQGVEINQSEFKGGPSLATKSQAQDDAEIEDFGVVLWAALDACEREKHDLNAEMV